MASKEPLDILTPRFIREVQEYTTKGQLYSSKSLANQLMLCKEATLDMRLEALKDQASLARRQRNHTWLKNVTKAADALAITQLDWICENITPIRHYKASGPSQGCDVEPMDIEVTPEEEEQLLRPTPGHENSPPVQDFDVDKLLRPDISGCPVSKRKVVPKWDPPVSSIAVEGRSLSPIRFPSPDRRATRQASPRKLQPSPVVKPRSPTRRQSPARRQRSPTRRQSPVRRPRSPTKRISPCRTQRSPARPARRRSRSVGRRKVAKTSRSKSPRKEPQKRHRSPRRDSSTRGLKRRHTAPSMRESSTKSEAGTEPCPVAGCLDVVSRAHAATHLPGIFEDTQELTEEMLRRQISALRIIESLVLGSVLNMEGLVTFVNQLR